MLRIIKLAALLALLALWAQHAEARLGGGHSYSSGRSSGSSSRGYSSRSYSSGGYSSSRSRGYSSSSSSSSVQKELNREQIFGLVFVAFSICFLIVFPRWLRSKIKSSAEVKAELLKVDPNFSKVLFIDFARLVYTRYLESRGERDKEAGVLRPFVNDALWQQMKKHDCLEAKDVVIGSCELSYGSIDDESCTLNCVVDANVSKLKKGAREFERYYVQDNLVFTRTIGALTQSPEQMRTLNCPSCGSPVCCDETGLCAHCGKAPKPGEGQWALKDIRSYSFEAVSKLDEKNNAQSRQFQTVKPWRRSADLAARLRDLKTTYEDFTLSGFHEKVRDCFYKLQKAWSSLQWEPTRTFQTAALYQTHMYWIEQYRRRGWRNVLQCMELLEMYPVVIQQDSFYSSITVRVYAYCVDFTEDQNGELVCGSRTDLTAFYEYWTFVRTRVKGENGHLKSCPNCGGKLEEALSQECTYCGGHIVSGVFDWTLSAIDQEEPPGLIVVDAPSTFGKAEEATLIKNLSSSNSLTRMNAIFGLTGKDEISDKAVSELMKLLKDENKIVQREAICAMYGLGPRAAEATSALKGIIDSKGPIMRAAALEALCSVTKDADIKADILARILSADEDDYIRFVAVSRLADLAPSGEVAIPVLLEAIDDDYRCVRPLAIDVLALFEEKASSAIPALLQKLASASPLEKEAAVKALGKISADGEACREQIEMLLNDNTDKVRKAAQACIEGWSKEERRQHTA